MDDRP